MRFLNKFFGDNALAGVDGELVDEMARDLLMAPADLVVAAHAAGAPELMPEMMREIGLDPEAIQAAMPGLYRDMAATCATCPSRDRCEAEMEMGTAGKRVDEFCPNAWTFEGLK
ncbi:DUF6455 family protein [Cucumibacter marinus]|uniref:DUF6455 family protein n=1 Tax=Cucumibacter marinus TaxID=1121252 RepID=UPI00042327BD|nr:DUF6455 family protein [Cucumibacter marinus]